MTIMQNTLDELYDLHNHKKSIRQIALNTGCNPSTLWRQINKLGRPTTKVLEKLERGGYIGIKKKQEAPGNELERIKELIGQYCFNQNNAHKAINIINSLLERQT